MRADSHSLKPNAELTSYLAPPQQGAFRKPSKCDSKIDINGEVKGCLGQHADVRIMPTSRWVPHSGGGARCDEVGII